MPEQVSPSKRQQAEQLIHQPSFLNRNRDRDRERERERERTSASGFMSKSKNIDVVANSKNPFRTGKQEVSAWTWSQAQSWQAQGQNSNSGNKNKIDSDEKLRLSYNINDNIWYIDSIISKYAVGNANSNTCLSKDQPEDQDLPTNSKIMINNDNDSNDNKFTTKGTSNKTSRPQSQAHSQRPSTTSSSTTGNMGLGINMNIPLPFPPSSKQVSDISNINSHTNTVNDNINETEGQDVPRLDGIQKCGTGTSTSSAATIEEVAGQLNFSEIKQNNTLMEELGVEMDIDVDHDHEHSSFLLNCSVQLQSMSATQSQTQSQLGHADENVNVDQDEESFASCTQQSKQLQHQEQPNQNWIEKQQWNQRSQKKTPGDMDKQWNWKEENIDISITQDSQDTSFMSGYPVSQNGNQNQTQQQQSAKQLQQQSSSTASQAQPNVIANGNATATTGDRDSVSASDVINQSQNRWTQDKTQQSGRRSNWTSSRNSTRRNSPENQMRFTTSNSTVNNNASSSANPNPNSSSQNHKDNLRAPNTNEGNVLLSASTSSLQSKLSKPIKMADPEEILNNFPKMRPPPILMNERLEAQAQASASSYFQSNINMNCNANTNSKFATTSKNSSGCGSPSRGLEFRQHPSQFSVQGQSGLRQSRTLQSPLRSRSRSPVTVPGGEANIFINSKPMKLDHYSISQNQPTSSIFDFNSMNQQQQQQQLQTQQSTTTSTNIVDSIRNKYWNSSTYQGSGIAGSPFSMATQNLTQGQNQKQQAHANTPPPSSINTSNINNFFSRQSSSASDQGQNQMQQQLQRSYDSGLPLQNGQIHHMHPSVSSSALTSRSVSPTHRFSAAGTSRERSFTVGKDWKVCAQQNQQQQQQLQHQHTPSLAIQWAAERNVQHRIAWDPSLMNLMHPELVHKLERSNVLNEKLQRNLEGTFRKILEANDENRRIGREKHQFQHKYNLLDHELEILKRQYANQKQKYERDMENYQYIDELLKAIYFNWPAEVQRAYHNYAIAMQQQSWQQWQQQGQAQLQQQQVQFLNQAGTMMATNPSRSPAEMVLDQVLNNPNQNNSNSSFMGGNSQMQNMSSISAVGVGLPPQAQNQFGLWGWVQNQNQQLSHSISWLSVASSPTGSLVQQGTNANQQQPLTSSWAQQPSGLCFSENQNNNNIKDRAAFMTRALQQGSAKVTWFDKLTQNDPEFKVQVLSQELIRRNEELERVRRNHNILYDEVSKLKDQVQELKGEGRQNHVVVKSSQNFGGREVEFGFDRVFGLSDNQWIIYDEVGPLLEGIPRGFHLAIFAYGQTGSGKTFTLDGTDNEPGILRSALKNLLDIGKPAKRTQHRLIMSVVEIYNETVRDLLSDERIQSGKLKGETASLEIRSCLPNSGRGDRPTPRHQADTHSSSGNSNNHGRNNNNHNHNQHSSQRERTNSFNNNSKDQQSNLNAHLYGSITVDGLSQREMRDVFDADVILRTARANRHTGATLLNDHSSRSHCIYSVGMVNDRGQHVGALHIIDLAGSERTKVSRAEGQRLVEAKQINKSLSALGDTLFALEQKQSHIPFRNSKLSYLLSDVLSQAWSKILLFATINPSEENVLNCIDEID